MHQEPRFNKLLNLFQIFYELLATIFFMVSLCQMRYAARAIYPSIYEDSNRQSNNILFFGADRQNMEKREAPLLGRQPSVSENLGRAMFDT